VTTPPRQPHAEPVFEDRLSSRLGVADRRKSSPTSLLCCFSHSNSDDVKGKFTSEIANFDADETVEAVPEGGEPEPFEVLAIADS